LTLLLAAWRKRKDVITGTVEGRKVEGPLPLPLPPAATGDAPRPDLIVEQPGVSNNGKSADLRNHAL
jgi:hypothetical protein